MFDLTRKLTKEKNHHTWRACICLVVCHVACNIARLSRRKKFLAVRRGSIQVEVKVPRIHKDSRSGEKSQNGGERNGQLFDEL
jgi:hypothetical protein